MLRVRKTTSILALLVAAAMLAVAALAAPRSDDDDRKPFNEHRVQMPVKLAILIQDDLVSHVGNEMKLTRDFIRSLPGGSRVMVAYVRSGSLQVRQGFTTDLAKAARAVRIPASTESASPYNPYVEVIEALRNFSAEDKNTNALLLISDGLDTSRGLDSATILQSIDLNRAIKEANRRDVAVYSFYAPSVGLSSRSNWAANLGQSSLNRLSNETGGKAFFQGTTDFVTFNSHFERLVDALNRQYAKEN